MQLQWQFHNSEQVDRDEKLWLTSQQSDSLILSEQPVDVPVPSRKTGHGAQKKKSL